MDHGTWETSGNSWSRFGLEDEKVVTAALGINFSEYAMPGLNWDLKAMHSGDARGYDNFSRNEYSSLLRYGFQNQLKGLSLIWYALDHQASGEIDGIERTVDVVGPARAQGRQPLLPGLFPGLLIRRNRKTRTGFPFTGAGFLRLSVLCGKCTQPRSSIAA
jgi:hypothetical protein